MAMELKIIGDTVAELGDQLYAMSLEFLGDRHPAKDAKEAKGLGQYADDDLLNELQSRGYSLAAAPDLSVSTPEQAAVLADEKPKGKKSQKKDADTAPAAADTEKTDEAESMTAQAAYDKAIDMAVVLYSGPAKDEVMAVLKHFDVKTFRDIDAETGGHEFYAKIKEIQDKQA